MAILEGGIFSNPRGKTGGIVFGAARTRTGKKVTSRLLVPPSNPNTAAQQVQRGKFAEALAIVRLVGSAFYQGDWNRAIGQLPGFQSMTSVFLTAMNADFEIQTIPSINLGSLHSPGAMVVDPEGSGGNIEVTWDTGLGLNGTINDVATILAIENAPGASPLERVVATSSVEIRDAGGAVLAIQEASTLFSVVMWFRGAGSADGLNSPTIYQEGTSSA